PDAPPVRRPGRHRLPAPVPLPRLRRHRLALPLAAPRLRARRGPAALRARPDLPRPRPDDPGAPLVLSPGLRGGPRLDHPPDVLRETLVDCAMMARKTAGERLRVESVNCCLQKFRARLVHTAFAERSGA